MFHFPVYSLLIYGPYCVTFSSLFYADLLAILCYLFQYILCWSMGHIVLPFSVYIMLIYGPYCVTFYRSIRTRATRAFRNSSTLSLPGRRSKRWPFTRVATCTPVEMCTLHSVQSWRIAKSSQTITDTSTFPFDSSYTHRDISRV